MVQGPYQDSLNLNALTPNSSVPQAKSVYEPYNPNLRLVTGDMISRMLASSHAEVGVTGSRVVGTTPVLLVPRNANRVTLTIENITSSAINVFFGFTQNVSTANGFRIQQNGTYEWNILNMYIGEIYVVAASASATIQYQELSKADVGVYDQGY